MAPRQGTCPFSYEIATDDNPYNFFLLLLLLLTGNDLLESSCMIEIIDFLVLESGKKKIINHLVRDIIILNGTSTVMYFEEGHSLQH